MIEAEDSAQRVDFPDGAEVTKTKPWRMVCKYIYGFKKSFM